MRYDFSRFSNQSFERFVQALAATAVGGRIQIYGAGKDGAREATFSGQCQIADRDWDGYVVFQAKYRETEGSPSSNAAWLIRQIEKEMQKFASQKRSLKRPDYYVIASNVRLSAAAAAADGSGQGGIDKVDEHLAGWALKLGFKGVHVWHADNLATLLDIHPEVRTLFTFWVQPGDVLSKVLRELSGPDQYETLLKYLRDTLRQSREIKTRDIGQAVGRTVTLDEVFTDLPVNTSPTRFRHRWTSREPEIQTETEGDEGQEEFPSDITIVDDQPLSQDKALSQLVRQTADTFTPQSWYEDVEENRDGCKFSPRGPMPNRVVLLGGPGQGKSTIAQFLAQYLRARLLHEMKSSQAPETNALVAKVLRSCEAQSIPRSGPMRYPFHVELPRYADLLNEAGRSGDHLSIVDHLAKEISKGTAPGLKASLVVEWLSAIPSVIILDGLDEVPHSGNRVAVVNAIEELLDVLHNANADAFVFATSRPQGYQEELSPKYWAHWNLDTLEPEDALNLAARVAPILVGEPSRRDEVLATLSSAAEDEATASLMTSPLQVMLLFHLVSTHNNVPKDRWTLFYRHYEILRDREIAKGGAAGATIRTYKTQIDRIHQDAGYLLQLRAEDTGGADAYFSDQEFRNLVRGHLEHDGFDSHLGGLTDEIANLATNRLVFLNSAVEGNVAFDVRSLQEFMAAARLTASPEVKIRDRLYEIAGRAHWQHVFKIACSKIFASTGHEALHDVIVGLLDGLDNGDRSADDRLLITGSKLAVDLLLDGSTSSLPSYQKRLISRAMKLVQHPEVLPVTMLKNVFDVSHRAFLEPLFVNALSQEPSVKTNMLQLLVLLSLTEKDSNWITTLLLAWWPSDIEEVLDIFPDTHYLSEQGLVTDRLIADLWQSSPLLVATWIDDLRRGDYEDDGIPDRIAICNGLPSRDRFPLLGVDGIPTTISFSYLKIENAMQVVEVPREASPAWKTARAASDFSASPSPQTAIAFLQVFSDEECFGSESSIALPWPLEVLAHSASDGLQCAARIRELGMGLLGNMDDWVSKQNEWDNRGVEVAEICLPGEQGFQIRDIPNIKCPPIIGRSINRDGVGGSSEVLMLVQRWPDAWTWRTFLFFVARQDHALSDATIATLIDTDFDTSDWPSAVKSYLATALLRAIQQRWNNPDLLRKLQESLQDPDVILPLRQDLFDAMLQLFAAYPNIRAFIPHIAAFYLRRWEGESSSLEMIAPSLLRSCNDDVLVAAGAAQLRIRAQNHPLDLDNDLNAVFAAGEKYADKLLQSLLSKKAFVDERLRLRFCREVILRRTVGVSDRAFRFLQRSDETRRTSLKDDKRAAELSLPAAMRTH